MLHTDSKWILDLQLAKARVLTRCKPLMTLFAVHCSKAKVQFIMTCRKFIKSKCNNYTYLFFIDKLYKILTLKNNKYNLKKSITHENTQF